MIRTDIPFYESFATPGHPTGVHCIEISLKMILGALMPGREFTVEELEAITGKQPEKGAWEMQYLIWLVDNGFEVQHWATFDYGAFEKEGIEYIRRAYGDETAEYQLRESDVPGAQKMIKPYLEKVTNVKKSPAVADIKDLMDDGWIVRASVNSRLLQGKDEYYGHSVVVIGFEGDDIIFHDPGLPPVRARRESCELFQRAMDSFGGEIDAIRKKGDN